MSPSSVPESVAALPLPHDVPGLVWTRNQLERLGTVGLPGTIEIAATGLLPVNTPVELEEGAFVILGEKIGEGRQGIVYSVATCDQACLKVCRNERAAKQFRRERVGAQYFDALGITYPRILAADELGRWIMKERWQQPESGNIQLVTGLPRLSPLAIHSLHEYVRKFERAGLCADWMPSNVLFRPGGCATYETAVWKVESSGWSFSTCFLPVWLPHGVAESSLQGFPPYVWSAVSLNAARHAWDFHPEYKLWRDLFGEFPQLCPDWWDSRVEG